ncbi:Pyruvate synthase subunit PorC [bioreactor metagenome]|uniref:Pyruvate synthase subunit PorC n=1 Tax=bioreactor metagenome TaxID=1076179 RepID=A0A644TT04_9ZZZZ|nr:2-oxoacid:acceptor oxidoreductase family protein [Negativicutes bacterium]
MKQLRLSGSGGQGLITAGIILAEAAIAEGKEAVQSQSYGPEARGGASKAEVIIDDKFIYHPKVVNPGVVLAMTQQAVDKYSADLAEGGLLIIDTDLVPNPPQGKKIISVPITKLSTEKLGRELFANIIALGLLVKITGVVSLDTIKAAVANRVPPHTVDKNMEALLIGYQAI